jgi:hypothetical protein
MSNMWSGLVGGATRKPSRTLGELHRGGGTEENELKLVNGLMPTYLPPELMDQIYGDEGFIIPNETLTHTPANEAKQRKQLASQAMRAHGVKKKK